MYVLYAFGHGATKCDQTFPRIPSSSGDRSTSNFFPEKCGPSPATGFPTYLNNQIAAFCSNVDWWNSMLWSSSRHWLEGFRGCWTWIWCLFASNLISRSKTNLIYKGECLSVYLFFMHLNPVHVRDVKPSRIFLPSRRRSRATFCLEITSPPPRRSLCFQPMELQYCLVCLKTSHRRFSRAVSPNLTSIWLESYWLT